MSVITSFERICTCVCNADKLEGRTRLRYWDNVGRTAENFSVHEVGKRGGSFARFVRDVFREPDSFFASRQQPRSFPVQPFCAPHGFAAGRSVPVVVCAMCGRGLSDQPRPAFCRHQRSRYGWELRRSRAGREYQLCLTRYNGSVENITCPVSTVPVVKNNLSFTNGCFPRVARPCHHRHQAPPM